MSAAEVKDTVDTNEMCLEKLVIGAVSYADSLGER